MARTNEPKVGFMGFGEAASSIASGLYDEGLGALYAYDINSNTRSGSAELIANRAGLSHTSLVQTPAELAEHSDVVISAVTSSEALVAAKSIAPFLNDRHIYADANAVAPGTMVDVEMIIGPTSARFVDVAMMDPVPNHRHKVTMMLSGKGATAFCEVMDGLHMNLRVVGDKPGQASAVKMFRSVFMKGAAALLYETLYSALKYGAEEIVVDSLVATLSRDPRQLVERLVSGTAVHSGRRIHEMEDVVGTLESIGVEPVMSRATVRMLEKITDAGVNQRFKSEAPKSYKDALKAVENYL